MGNRPLRVFLSYRRDDAGYPASSLYRELTVAFGAENVFKDVDSIALGDDYVHRIISAVTSSDVLLALIGRSWLTIADDRGRRRIDAPGDLVRLEIETAIRTGRIVVPVVLDGTTMPGRAELPPSIEALHKRQAAELSSAHFESDVGRLISKLRTTRMPPPAVVGSPHHAVAPPRRPQLSASLTLDDASGRPFVLRQGTTTIGRGAAADMQVPDPDLDEIHLEVD
jgi:hypothetical protein